MNVTHRCQQRLYIEKAPFVAAILHEIAYFKRQKGNFRLISENKR